MRSIWWIRRDLRLEDNLTLQEAVKAESVLPVYILDPKLLAAAPRRKLDFLFANLSALDQDLRGKGSYLIVRRGDALSVLQHLAAEYQVDKIFAEEDFTPYAIARDKKVQAKLPLELVQGQLAHHPAAVQKADGKPYTVFTPYSKVWKRLLPKLSSSRAPQRIATPAGIDSEPIPVHESIPHFPAGEDKAIKRLQDFFGRDQGVFAYRQDRDRVDLSGTSSLSPYIHFGVLGLRTAVRFAQQAIEAGENDEVRKSAETWLNELIWREFYIQILYHFPHVLKGSFRPQYDQIKWANKPEDFEAWKNGLTGYPVVDAAMRQLKQTGWMHNRARMVTASFLVKDLLIDWRWGERWFMQNLLDGDLAANNGGWQWTAGTGTDAAPYFRIFNPVLQSKKFDPNGDYIREWVPELAHLSAKQIHMPSKGEVETSGYPRPIIDHKLARQRTLAAYKAVR